jgi:quercetin dioxygenase-like cupin family protein
MQKFIWWSFALTVASAAGVLMAQEAGIAKPELLLQEVIGGMPKTDKQEVRVMTASFKPGDRTTFHTHPFPVAVYVLEGTFTLELEGRSPVTLKPGQTYLEPPHVKMTGFNRSATEPLRVVIFYVSEPGVPFLHPAH